MWLNLQVPPTKTNHRTYRADESVSAKREDMAAPFTKRLRRSQLFEEAAMRRPALQRDMRGGGHDSEGGRIKACQSHMTPSSTCPIATYLHGCCCVCCRMAGQMQRSP
jgi:hypothetical protein